MGSSRRRLLNQSTPSSGGVNGLFCILGKCEELASLDGQPVHLRSSILVDVQMGEQSNPTFDPFRGGKPPLSGRQRILWMRERHGEGLGDDDGAPSQSRCPMPLLSVVALQGDSLALALVMAANRQHQRVDDIAIGAEQGHLPAREAFEQPPEGPLVAVAAPGRAARRSRSRHCGRSPVRPCRPASRRHPAVRRPPWQWSKCQSSGFSKSAAFCMYLITAGMPAMVPVQL
jgi:hypothetical protein